MDTLQAIYSLRVEKVIDTVRGVWYDARWIIHEESDMRMVIDDFTSVISDLEGSIYVTRPNMHGKVVTHKLATKEYSELDIAVWLGNRIKRQPNPYAQEAFPLMSAEDREFLMTGITPAEWQKMFPKEDE